MGARLGRRSRGLSLGVAVPGPPGRFVPGPCGRGAAVALVSWSFRLRGGRRVRGRRRVRAPGLLHPNCIRGATARRLPPTRKCGDGGRRTADEGCADKGESTWDRRSRWTTLRSSEQVRELAGGLTDDEAALVRMLTPADLNVLALAEHKFDLVELLETIRERRGDGRLRLRHRAGLGRHHRVAAARGQGDDHVHQPPARAAGPRRRPPECSGSRPRASASASGVRLGSEETRERMRAWSRSSRAAGVGVGLGRAQSSSPIRASHRPGASTSAGVGRSISSVHSRVSASSPARSMTPVTKARPRSTSS